MHERNKHDGARQTILCGKLGAFSSYFYLILSPVEDDDDEAIFCADLGRSSGVWDDVSPPPVMPTVCSLTTFLDVA